LIIGIGNYVVSYGLGVEIPDNAVLYEDGTPVKYEDDNYVLYES
jgi:hypothetical protein